MPCGGGGVPHRILLLLSCHAAGCMRGHGRGRTFVLVARAAGNCARRIGEGSLWNPPASGGVCGASGGSRTHDFEEGTVFLSLAFKESWSHGR